MSEENKALVRRWFEEVWNKGRAEAIDEMLNAEGVVHGLADNETMRGTGDFKKFHAAYLGAFPGMEVIVEDMVAEGDKVATRCRVRGQHQGDHLGFKATNAPVEFTGITIVTIKDGKIVEAWNNFDFMSMNKQLGVL